MIPSQPHRETDPEGMYPYAPMHRQPCATRGGSLSSRAVALTILVLPVLSAERPAYLNPDLAAETRAAVFPQTIGLAATFDADLAVSTAVPVASLKGSQRVALVPGASATVTFTITPDLMEMVNLGGERILEKGDRAVPIGGAPPGYRLGCPTTHMQHLPGEMNRSTAAIPLLATVLTGHCSSLVDRRQESLLWARA